MITSAPPMELSLSYRAKPLYRYLAAHQPPEHDERAKLRDATSRMPNAFMQIAPEQGNLLAFLISSIGARVVLELGTFTGYSALVMALALPDDGRLITCDVNREYVDVARPFWQRAGVQQKIEVRIGPARCTMRELEQAGAAFDFVFIDANKDDYDHYYEAALGMMRHGAIVVLDNMLWHGRVANPDDHEAEATALRELNTKIVSDERVDRVMLPIGDGMTLVRRR